MKKILSLLLIACLSFGILGAFSVSAANDEVLMGTPVLDGKLDGLYLDSAKIEFTDGVNKNAFNEAANAASASKWNKDDTAVIYALYDAEFVYLCAVVKDNDVVQPDASHYDKWNANGFDGVEFRLNFCDTEDTSKQFKVTADAHGKVRHNYGDDAKGCFTIQPAICDITKCEVATSLTADGYIVEAKVAHSYNDSNKLLEAGKLGMNVWILDLQEEAAGALDPVIHAEYLMYGEDLGKGNGAAVPFTLSSQKAVDNTASQGGATGSDDAGTAPNTFDVAVVAAVVAVVSGAAVVVGKKRR